MLSAFISYVEASEETVDLGKFKVRFISIIALLFISQRLPSPIGSLEAPVSVPALLYPDVRSRHADA
jgi:hypothetical protein